MEIVNVFFRTTGTNMKPTITRPGAKLLPKRLGAVEKKWKFEFPHEYREFLLAYNGGTPDPRGFRIKGRKRATEVCEHFLGISTGRLFDDLPEALETYKGEEPRMPTRLVPIASDPFGNCVCISASGKDRGKIYFWHHEEEFMQEPLRSGGLDDAAVFVIADSFEAFLDQFEAPEKSEAKRYPWKKMIRADDLSSFREWLQGKVDPEQQDRAVYMAIKEDKYAFVQESVKRGYPLEKVVENAVNCAAYPLLKKVLKETKSKIRIEEPYMAIALRFCEDVEVIEMLLDAGAPFVPETALHDATEIADPEIIALLLKKGARSGVPDSRGRLALTNAICRQRVETAKLLMKAGENLYFEPPNPYYRGDEEMLAELKIMERQPEPPTEFIEAQRARIEHNRTKPPVWYLDLFPKNPRMKKELLAYASKLRQRPSSSNKKERK